MVDQIIIAFLMLTSLALCFFCWWQDNKIEQLEGYIKRIEREKESLRLMLSRVPASAAPKVFGQTDEDSNYALRP